MNALLSKQSSQEQKSTKATKKWVNECDQKLPITKSQISEPLETTQEKSQSMLQKRKKPIAVEVKNTIDLIDASAEKTL